MQDGRAAAEEFPDEIAHDRRLRPEAVDVRTVDVCEAEAYDVHAVAGCERTAELFRGILGARVNEAGRHDRVFHGREGHRILVDGGGAGEQKTFHAVRTRKRQKKHRAAHVDGKRVGRTVLAVGKWGDARKVIDDLELLFREQSVHGAAVGHRGADDLIAEIVIREDEIVFRTVGEIVEQRDVLAHTVKTVGKLRSDEARGSGHEDPAHAVASSFRAHLPSGEPHDRELR